MLKVMPFSNRYTNQNPSFQKAIKEDGFVENTVDVYKKYREVDSGLASTYRNNVNELLGDVNNIPNLDVYFKKNGEVTWTLPDGEVHTHELPSSIVKNTDMTIDVTMSKMFVHSEIGTINQDLKKSVEKIEVLKKGIDTRIDAQASEFRSELENHFD